MRFKKKKKSDAQNEKDENFAIFPCGFNKSKKYMKIHNPSLSLSGLWANLFVFKFPFENPHFSNFLKYNAFNPNTPVEALMSCLCCKISNHVQKAFDSTRYSIYPRCT